MQITKTNYSQNMNIVHQNFKRYQAYFRANISLC